MVQFQGDWILFTHEGGVDVGDVDAKAEKLLIPSPTSSSKFSNEEIAATLLSSPYGVLLSHSSPLRRLR